MYIFFSNFIKKVLSYLYLPNWQGLTETDLFSQTVAHKVCSVDLRIATYKTQLIVYGVQRWETGAHTSYCVCKM